MNAYLKKAVLYPALLLVTLMVQRAAADEPAPPVPAVGVAPIPVFPRPAAVVEVASDEPVFSYITVGTQTCAPPCRLLLLPGVQPVIASGRATFVGHLEVPSGAARIDVVDRTGGYRVAGAIMIPLGLVTASGLWAIGLACGYNSGGCQVANYTLWPVLGAASLFTGIGLLGYAASHDRYGLRVTPDSRLLGAAPRLTSLGVGPTGNGAALGAAFEF
jgi:hypothetical protein